MQACILWMMWMLQGEEVLANLTHYVAWLKPRKKIELRCIYDKAIKSIYVGMDNPK